jgi:hypothetical protein
MHTNADSFRKKKKKKKKKVSGYIKPDEVHATIAAR